MYKYLGNMLDTATLVGEVTKIDMDEASRYSAAHIDIHGITATGEKFELYLTVGERKHEDS